MRVADAIFALGVYRSDLAGVLQEFMDGVNNDVITFYSWGYGAAVGPTEALEPFVVMQLVTRLLGYGIRGLDNPFPTGFYWRNGLSGGDPIYFIELPLKPSAVERLMGQALPQDSKRRYRKRGGQARINRRAGPDEPSPESRAKEQAESKSPTEAV